jgi:uracil-DNA glycosylase family 4
MTAVARKLLALHDTVARCDRCARLRTYCATVAQTKRRAYLNWDYWGRPVPGFGDPDAWLWIIGLAPAAHGANRTGRNFTGDRSGDFLYAALHRAGLASQPTSVSKDDGLTLSGCYISATVRCAPPDNKPLPDEIANCSTYADAEWDLLRNKRILLALGKIGWDAAISLALRKHCEVPRPRPPFAHGALANLGHVTLIGSYHVSQQNTFTGKLTPAMFDEVLKRCTSARYAGLKSTLRK